MLRKNKPVFGICSLKPENSGNDFLTSVILTIKFVQDIIEVNPCTKYRDDTSNCLAVRDLSDRHADTKAVHHPKNLITNM